MAVLTTRVAMPSFVNYFKSSNILVSFTSPFVSIQNERGELHSAVYVLL